MAKPSWSAYVDHARGFGGGHNLTHTWRIRQCLTDIETPDPQQGAMPFVNNDPDATDEWDSFPTLGTSSFI